MKWCYFGCSHSSPTWGKPWPRYVADYFGSEPILDGYSQGAGNEFALIKLLTAISQKPELIIWQLTEFTRMTWGIDGYIGDDPNAVLRWNDPFSFDRARYYTFNVVSNYDALNRMLGKGSYADLDKFITRHVAISTLNHDIKPLQSILLAQLACRYAGVKLLIFKWWEQPVKDTLVTQTIKKQICWEDILEEAVWQYLEREKGEEWIKEHDVEGFHLDSEAHKVISNDLLIPFIRRRLDAKENYGLVA